MTSKRRTQHPGIPDDKDGAVEAMRESLEIGRGERGDKKDAWVTFRDLEDAGLAKTSAGSGGRLSLSGGSPGGNNSTGPFGPDGGGPLDFGENDPTKPPKPTGVRARGLSLDSIGVTWNPAPYNNHAYAEVFASFADNLDAIRNSFDPEKPITPDNQSAFYMGNAVGNQFIHRGLDSTVPTLEVERPVSGVSDLGNGNAQFTMANANDGFLTAGDTLTFFGPDGWGGVGVQGEVVGFGSSVVTVNVQNPPAALFDGTEGLTIQKQWTEGDDLDAALNPDPVFYWVRFVSTAGVSGDWQSEAGVRGAVFINPTEVLNVLTGRIRSSQLANDLLAPINFVRGPISELDDDGNRRFPTVRSFVETLGDEAITEYDETWEQVFLGFAGVGTTSVNVSTYQQIVSGSTPDFQRFSLTTSDFLTGVEVGDDVRLFAIAGSPLSSLNNRLLRVTRITSQGYFLANSDPSISIPVGVFTGLSGVTLQAETSVPGARPGVAAAAALVEQVRGEANANGAYIEALQTLEAAFEESAPGNEDGLLSILATAQERALVRATDSGALSYIGDNVQIAVGDDVYAVNEVGNEVLLDHRGRLTNSFTVRAQQNRGGVLFAAGMGLSLEEGENGDLTSSFIVAADQFAIMGAGNAGRRILEIKRDDDATRYRCLVDSSQSRSVIDDKLEIGTAVSITVPSKARESLGDNGDFIVDALQGETFEVIERDAGFFSSDPFYIYIGKPESNGVRPALPAIPEADVSASGFAMFPETNIPFIVDTETATVGIRGRLIVDGMISATSAQIGELAATTVWAETITAFGLVNTKALIGETIATPRRGGWAVKISTPNNVSGSKALELSKWGFTTDSQLPDEQVEYESQAENYPQLRGDTPQDSAFWLDSFDGSAYIRGNLTVGGNARIWTGYTQPGQETNARWFVQLDHQFPIAILPRDNLPSWYGTEEGKGVDYGVGSGRTNEIKNLALFWAARDGTAGFNTVNEAIYINDTPLEPPSGLGTIEVKTRLGQPTGRVYMQMSFALSNNQVGDPRFIGYTAALFLADAGTDYGAGDPQRIVPSQRDGIASISLGATSPFMNAHFLIIRATSSNRTFNGVQYSDPGYRAYEEFLQQYPSLRNQRAAEWYDNAPGQKMIAGAVQDIPASAGYKMLVVLVERYTANGDFITSASAEKLLPWAPSAFVQQVSSVPTPTAQQNTGAASEGPSPGGSSSGNPGGGDTGTGPKSVLN